MLKATPKPPLWAKYLTNPQLNCICNRTVSKNNTNIKSQKVTIPNRFCKIFYYYATFFTRKLNTNSNKTKILQHSSMKLKSKKNCTYSLLKNTDKKIRILEVPKLYNEQAQPFVVSMLHYSNLNPSLCWREKTREEVVSNTISIMKSSISPTPIAKKSTDGHLRCLFGLLCAWRRYHGGRLPHAKPQTFSRGQS